VSTFGLREVSMSTQHTPGPWTYEPEEEGYAGAIVAETGWICDFDTDPSPANARLIAAAPDLLDALCMVLDDPDALDGRPLTYECVRAAIAKATGETL
jgi:hypothetical protein